MNIDKETFVNYLFSSPSYKEVGPLVLIFTSSQDSEKTINEWLNKLENIRKLSFVEVLSDDNNLINHKKIQMFIEQVKNGQKITLQQWQVETNGQCLLLANGHIFATTPIAIQMAIDLGGKEIEDILKPVIENIYQQKQDYEKYFNGSLNNIEAFIKYYCIYDLVVLDDCWYQYFYLDTEREKKLYGRADYITTCLQKICPLFA